HKTNSIFLSLKSEAENKRVALSAKVKDYSLTNREEEGLSNQENLINMFMLLIEQLKDIAPAGQHILISLANIKAIKKIDAFQITEVKEKGQS
ncbi:hypothetical protein PSHT_08744, partial [Puccinia striiformis]